MKLSIDKPRKKKDKGKNNKCVHINDHNLKGISASTSISKEENSAVELIESHSRDVHNVQSMLTEVSESRTSESEHVFVSESLSEMMVTSQIQSTPSELTVEFNNDLDDQLFDTFASSEQLLRQIPNQPIQFMVRVYF